MRGSRFILIFSRLEIALVFLLISRIRLIRSSSSDEKSTTVGLSVIWVKTNFSLIFAMVARELHSKRTKRTFIFLAKERNVDNKHAFTAATRRCSGVHDLLSLVGEFHGTST